MYGAAAAVRVSVSVSVNATDMLIVASTYVIDGYDGAYYER